ncbi:MAG: hypothetical protein ABIQ74_04555 [Chitinophagales bacterium]
MDIFIDEHQQLLFSLLKHDVKFIMIGGYAVIFYGYERLTGDLDIWLQPDNGNKQKFLNALNEFGIVESNMEQIKQIDFTNAQMFYIGEKPKRIDFLTLVNGVSFEDAFRQVNYFPLHDKLIPVIQYQHLILTKISTGRAKDKADIEELQRINKYRKKT